MWDGGRGEYGRWVEESGEGGRGECGTEEEESGERCRGEWGGIEAHAPKHVNSNLLHNN